MPELGHLNELNELLREQGFAENHPYRLILVRMAEIDSDISKSEYGEVNDSNDQPPDEDDYYLLCDAIIQEITAGLTP